jgi:hypothetical protein
MKFSRRLLLLLAVPITLTDSLVNSRRQSRASSIGSSSYGKGAEIWPPGSDEPIDIRDSFPGGVIPFLAEKKKKDEDPLRWKNITLTGRTVIDKLLRHAALLQEDQPSTPRIDSTALLVAVAMVRYLKPVDFLLVVAATGYFIVLQKLAAQQRSIDNLTPMLPALPPQGHVPVSVKTPLGFAFSRSRDYFRWLKLGEILGFFGPLVLMVSTKLGDSRFALPAATAPLIARPLFLSSCQAATEHVVTRRVTTPLPIRILAPILYNWIRIGYLWNWAVSDMVLGGVGRGLAIANLAYTTINLWGFLIPIASMRYMRAHFFGVEAVQVLTRTGMEDSVGFLT